MSPSSFINALRERASERNARVAFPDADDVRTLEAASILAHSGIIRPVLVGNPEEIRRMTREEGIDLFGVHLVDPLDVAGRDEVVGRLADMRRSKGWDADEARRRCMDPLIAAGMLLSFDEVDAVVAGSISATSAVLRAALTTIPLSEGVRTLSSFFLMILQDRILAFADCAVVPEPTSEQLCDIAYSTSRNMRSVAEIEPRVAFLSFATKGSAEHASNTAVRTAAELFLAKHPEIVSDGELQADVALVRSVAERKAAGSPIQGDANVLVFPDLMAGNIAYKLTERLAGATALGPIVQGLSKPYVDLSRGCTSEDIVNVACIAVVMR